MDRVPHPWSAPEILTLRDIAAFIVDEIELRSQSIRDPLTGLFNRRFLSEVLEREVSRARRHRRALSVILLDLDHFKLVNDCHGHQAGDQALRELAAFLDENIRCEDTAFRYGGDEFLLVLPGASVEDACRRAQQLQDGAERLILSHDGQVLKPTAISAGVAGMPTHGNTPDALIQAADTALYLAKAQGRNRIATPD
jgi:diguanylate cyclase (GGDEF)-like protein